MRRPMLRMWWCRWFGHDYRPSVFRDGEDCRRCGDWRPTYKQHFGRVTITGPKPFDWDREC